MIVFVSLAQIASNPVDESSRGLCRRLDYCGGACGAAKARSEDVEEQQIMVYDMCLFAALLYDNGLRCVPVCCLTLLAGARGSMCRVSWMVA